MQGVTVTKGSKLVIHWQKAFKPGMAYVMLGRCESIKDIYISGEFDPANIKCDKAALAEAQRIDEVVRARDEIEQLLQDKMWTVSFINVRSLPAHFADVESVPILKQSHVFACGETWMHPGQAFELDGYNGAFENCGHGKGLAVFSRLLDATTQTYSSEKFSAALVTSIEFNMIFAYLSKGFDWLAFQELLDHWIQDAIPTVLLGDVNWHWNSNHLMKTYMTGKGFTQLINRATQLEGHILDHVYVSHHFPKEVIRVNQQSVTFSDHDVITLSLAKQ